MGAFAWNPNDFSGGGGSGNVFGPASSTDSYAAVWDGTTGTLLRDSNLLVTSTGAIRTTNSGSASFPSWSWTNDADCGMYRIGTNQIGFATAGVLALSIDGSQAVTMSPNAAVGLNINRNSASATGLQITNTSGSKWLGVTGTSFEIRETNNGGSVLFSLTNAGAATIGAPGGTQTNYIYGNFLALGGATSTTAPVIYNTNATAGTTISGGTSGTTGGNIRMYGQSHASRSNKIEFYNNTTQVGQINGSGAWTLGASGGSQTHSLNTATATSATAGANGDVPAQVVGYITININGTDRKIPYYAT